MTDAMLRSKSGALLGRGARGTLATQSDTAETADQADEGPAVGTGIALGGALFLSAGATPHPIVLLNFGHALLKQ
jgi:hypothetical protein